MKILIDRLNKFAKFLYSTKKIANKLNTEIEYTKKIDRINSTESKATDLNKYILNFKKNIENIEPIVNKYLQSDDARLLMFNQNKEALNTFEQDITDIRTAIDDQAQAVKSIDKFVESVKSSAPAVYEKINIEEHRLAVDFKHKLFLTFLRVFQIFIFVFSTYWAATLAVKSITHFDLSPPRMPFSIVPNVVTKTTKTIESVTNSGIAPDQS
jgi:hypothetical protein